MVDLASTIFRDFETDGVPSSGNHKPRKSKIREWGAWLEGRQTGSGLLFGFSVSTTDGDPGAGLFRMNNASPAAATKLFVDNVDASGSDVGDIIAGWDDSTSSVRGTIVFRGVDNSSLLYAYNVTGVVVDGSGYRKIDVVHVGGAGDFADGEEYILAFSRTGDASYPGFTADGTVPARTGFFIDDEPTTRLFRLRDRLFIGDGVDYTGRRTAPLGGSWLTEYGANYFEKNAQVTILSSESGGRIGILAASRTEPGVGSVTNMAIGAVTLNEGNASTGRAFYAEALNKGSANSSVGIEVQGGDFTATDHVANAYSVTGGYIGFYAAVEAAHGYTVGDSGTPVDAPSKPGNAAFDIAGGTQGGVSGNYRWRTGIVFRNGSLYRHIDGLTGRAKAISMAQGHEIVWEASSALRGATLRSDVTAVAGQDVGIIFQNTAVRVTGAGERNIAEFVDDTTAAGAVNYWRVINSRNGIPLSIRAAGTDTNIAAELQTKGIGIIRFLSHDGSGEHFRVNPTSQAVNFVSVTGGTAGINPRLEAAGSDTNRSLILRGKGTGGARLEDGGSAAKVEVNTTGVGFFGVSPVARPFMAAATGTATRTAFDTASVTLPQLAERVKAIIDDLRAYGLHA